MTMNVISSESGSATAGMSVSRARPRKTKITSTTSTNAMHRTNCTSSALLTIVCERSWIGMIRTEPGSVAWILGIRSLTDRATSTAFDPACR